MRDAFVNKVCELAEKDPMLMLITADLGFGIFDEFSKLHPNKFLNVGVAEQNMIGIATGMALEGHKVFVYSIGNFATLRCLEQIRNDAAYHNKNITIVASGGGFTYGALGMSHHATEDISIMRSLPGVTVIAPSNAWEALEATQKLFEIDGVCYLRLEKGGTVGHNNNNGHHFEVGKAISLKQGNDITIIVTGGILCEALKADEQLRKIGINANLLSMHTVKPIDRAAIVKAALETKAIITVEEHNIIGGLGSTVSEVIAQEGLVTRFCQLGVPDKYSSVVGDQNFLRKYYNLDCESIVNKSIEITQGKFI